jgi:hypothetical protein
MKALFGPDIGLSSDLPVLIICEVDAVYEYEGVGTEGGRRG